MSIRLAWISLFSRCLEEMAKIYYMLEFSFIKWGETRAGISNKYEKAKFKQVQVREHGRLIKPFFQSF